MTRPRPLRALLTAALPLTLASLAILSSPASAQESVGAAIEAVCCGASCCDIDGQCRSRGEANPANRCETCVPTTSRSAWTTTPGCTPGGGDAGGGADAGGAGGGGGCAVSPTAPSGVRAALALLGLAALAARRRR